MLKISGIPKNKLNLLFYFLGIAISGLLSFVFIPIVVRLYNIETYNNYSLVFNSLCITAMFCYAWLGQSYIRFHAKFSQALLSVSMSLLAKSLSIGAVIFVLINYLLVQISFVEIIIFIPSFFLFGYYCFFLLMCQAKQNAILVMLCEVIRTFINISLLLLLNKFFGSKQSMILLSIALFTSYAVPTVIMYLKNDLKTLLIIDKKELIEIKGTLKSYGLPIAFFLSASLALSVNDRYIISYFIGGKEAGIYSAIYDVINKGITAIFSPILMTFYPIIATFYNNGHQKEAYKKLKLAILIEGLLIIVGFVILYFTSPFLLRIIFHKEMRVGLNLVVYLIYIGVALWQLAMLMHKPLELLQKTKHMAFAVFVCLIINVFANIFFIKIYPNIIIPAIITIVSSLIYLIIVFFYSKKENVRSN